MTAETTESQACLRSLGQCMLERQRKESDVAQLYPPLCDPMDCSLPCSVVHGIFQARILQWVAIPSPENLPDAGIKPGSPTSQAHALPSEPAGNQRQGLTVVNGTSKPTPLASWPLAI